VDEVFVSGAFDDVRAPQMRFLEEAARLGPLHVLLWSDAILQSLSGHAPNFPAAERRYFLEGVRYVNRVSDIHHLPGTEALPQKAQASTPIDSAPPAIWAVPEKEDTPAKQAWCSAHGIAYRVIGSAGLENFPPPQRIDASREPGVKKVVVTGCYDWLHSGHIRFFEEASTYGRLYVVVGNDANVRNLKGEGHPLFPQALRRYMVGSIRFVHQALITSGWGWMDAEPDIAVIRPDIYLVNEDGDKPEKLAFCREHGLEYVVLKRLPRHGLQPRSSTDLRGY
jgi:cytidyltransferase-like protein